MGTTTRLKHSKASSNDWFTVFPNARFGELFDEAFRVLKRNTHLYLFCDAETMFVAKPEAERAGFKFWKDMGLTARNPEGTLWKIDDERLDPVYALAGELGRAMAVAARGSP